jgi:hypothetical protein
MQPHEVPVSRTISLMEAPFSARARMSAFASSANRARLFPNRLRQIQSERQAAAFSAFRRYDIEMPMNIGRLVG